MQFVAITDPGTPLEKLAAEAAFRRTFLNPPSIGGRYSALSFFGLVPAALIGVDVRSVLERAQAWWRRAGASGGLRQSRRCSSAPRWPAFARAGRDKVTLVFSEKIRSLGAWIEQLLAESLGKNGRGVVPVDGEPLGAPTVYGDDRVFVAIVLEGDTSHDAALAAARRRRASRDPPRARGPPRPRRRVLPVGARHRGGGGTLFEVNPFDEPDVAAAKEKTSDAARPVAQGAAAARMARRPRRTDGLVFMTGGEAPAVRRRRGCAAHSRAAAPGDYLSIHAYLTPLTETGERSRRSG